MGHESDPARASARRATRARELGPNPACAICGIEDIETLKRRRIEDHHLVGRHFDVDLTAPLCLNCHAVITAKQTDADALAALTQPNVLERLVRMLRSLNTLFEQLADWVLRLADDVEQFIDQLDYHLPNWRTLEGAHP